jgi:hypothetical protein
MDQQGMMAGGNPISEREIGERLALIESMMQAGRKSTEYWGWAFLLGGLRIWWPWHGQTSCRWRPDEHWHGQ